jgi:hypothetical protein
MRAPAEWAKWAKWHGYWFAPETAEHLALVRVISYSLLFAIYLPFDDRGWTQVSPVFWMPISHPLRPSPRCGSNRRSADVMESLAAHFRHRICLALEHGDSGSARLLSLRVA